jgi:hypothetical protein
VEIRYLPPDTWSGLIRVAPFADRNYEVFSWLFGVRNHGEFAPLAAQRGLPEDVSEETKASYEAAVTAYGREYHAPTWITWAEIDAIDWDERIDDRVLECKKGQPLVGWIEHWRARFVQEHPDRLPDPVEQLQPDAAWEHGEKAYVVVRTLRRDVLDDSWVLLFRTMELLARKYGDDGVRMVVWFDG